MRHLLRITYDGTFRHSPACGYVPADGEGLCLCTDARLVDCEKCKEMMDGNEH